MRLFHPFILLTAFLLSMVLPGSAHAQHPALRLAQLKHTRWTVDDGVPNPIYSMVQSKDGFIWLGTRDGVFRFDGVRFEEIAQDPKADIKLGAQKLLAARDGSVWVGFREGGVGVYRDGAIRDTGLKRWPWPSSIMAMAQSTDGSIWVGGYSRERPLARFRNGKWVRFGVEQGLPPEQLMCLLAARGGRLWVVTTHSIMLLRAGASRFERFPVPIRGRAAISEDSSGRIWLSDALGSRAIDPAPAPGPSGFAYRAPDFQRARQAIFDRNGNLWSADGFTGLWVTRSPNPAGAPSRAEADAQVEQFGTRDGLVSENVTTIMEDHEGSIWVGSLLGLDRFRVASVTAEPALTNLAPWGYTVFSASDGTVYVNQANSVYRVRPGGQPEPVIQNISLNKAICQAPDKSMYVGVRNGLLKLNGEGRKLIPIPEAKNELIITCLFDKNNNTWAVLDNIGLFKRINSGWVKIYNKPDDLLRDSVTELDGSGNIIMYSDDILTICSVRNKCLISNKDIPNLTVIHNTESGLIGGGRTGLVRIKKGRIERLSSDRFPFLKGVEAILQTRAGETWLMADAGIVRLSSSALNDAFGNAQAPLKPLILSMRDGLPGVAIRSNVQQAAEGGDGRLWFVTSAGVVWVDPRHLPHNPLAPNVAIGSLAAGGILYRDPLRITLPPGTSGGEIDFAALSFAIPQRTEVRYQLEGTDVGWVDPGMRRQAFFSNLSPGTYRFRVMASNNDGVWNRKGATLEFTIPPTFRQSIWFKLLCALLIAALLWCAYSLRLRQVTGRFQETLEVRLTERERIARELHDTLLQGFQGLILRFQAMADRLPASTPWRDLFYKELDHADAVLIAGRERVGDVRATDTGEDLSQSIIASCAGLRADAQMRLDVTIEGEHRILHPIVRQEVQRIAEEGIRNAFRHSRGTAVSVTLVYNPRQFRLQVRDDGSGLPEDIGATGARQGHFGLPGMRERAQQIGGMLAIVSRQGEGTEILLSIPGRAAYASRNIWRRPFRVRVSKKSVEA